MRTTTRRALSLSVLCLLVVGAARAARADNPDGKKAPAAAPGAPAKADEASERFRSGVAFYKDRDFTAALVEFKRAYELAPNYRVLFNLGQTARELKDYAAALSAFEQYLREGGKDVPAARRKDVQAFIDELKRKVGKITVTTSVEGAEVLVDDVSAGVTPLAAPIVVNVGRHKFVAKLSGYAPGERVVDVAGMAEVPLALELTKVQVASTTPDPQAQPAKPGIPTVVWVMLSTTAASLVVTSVMGGLAISSRSGLDTALATYPGDPSAIAGAQSRTKTFAVGADVAAGLTIAAAASTVLLYVFLPRDSSKAAPAPSVGISPTGLVLRGTF